MPRMLARYQSAGAVNIAMRSPSPARFISAGAPARTSVSTIRASAQVLGTVRLTPLRRSTDRSSAKPLTLAALWTIT